MTWPPPETATPETPLLPLTRLRAAVLVPPGVLPDPAGATSPPPLPRSGGPLRAVAAEVPRSVLGAAAAAAVPAPEAGAAEAPFVAADEVPRGAVRPAERAARPGEDDAVAAVAEVGRAVAVGADVVALNRVGAAARAADAFPVVAGDEVALRG